MSNQKEKDSMRDEGLKGNEQIEEAILALQQEAIRNENVTCMRSSIMLLGAMLGRIGEVSLAYPGGCVIG